MKTGIIIGTIALVLNLAFLLFAAFFLLVALNGYNESDGLPGLIVFGVLAIIARIVFAILSVFAYHKLVAREFGAFVAALLSIVPAWIVCSIVICIAGLIGVGVAEFVRVNY